MTENYTHYCMFAVEVDRPSCADDCGLLKWRTGFEKLPKKEWTTAERWIHELEKPIPQVSRIEPFGVIRTGGFKKSKGKKAE